MGSWTLAVSTMDTGSDFEGHVPFYLVEVRVVLKAEQRFMAAVTAYESDSLASFFAQWMDDLQKAAMWKEGAPDDVRVPIGSMVTDHRLPGFQVPNAPGIYLWGSNTSLTGDRAFVPRKIGQSGASPSPKNMRDRIRRYKTKTRGGDTQGSLAAEHRNRFWDAARQRTPSWPPTPHGYPGLIKAIAREVAREITGKSNAPPGRWRGAADWALHSRSPDLEEIWVAFLVVPSPTDHQRALLSLLEEQLQSVAKAWNYRAGVAPMIDA